MVAPENDLQSTLFFKPLGFIPDRMESPMIKICDVCSWLGLGLFSILLGFGVFFPDLCFFDFDCFEFVFLPLGSLCFCIWQVHH